MCSFEKNEMMYAGLAQNATWWNSLLIISIGYKLMSVNPVLWMLAPVASVSNRNFIRTSLKEAKPTTLENRLFQI